MKSLPRHPGVGSSTQVCRRWVCVSSSVIVVGGTVRDGGGPCAGSVGSVGSVGNGYPWGFCQFHQLFMLRDVRSSSQSELGEQVVEG